MSRPVDLSGYTTTACSAINKSPADPIKQKFFDYHVFLRLFRKVDKVRTILILYKIDVTKFPRSGHTYPMSLTSGVEIRTIVPDYILKLSRIDVVHLGERGKYVLNKKRNINYFSFTFKLGTL